MASSLALSMTAWLMSVNNACTGPPAINLLCIAGWSLFEGNDMRDDATLGGGTGKDANSLAPSARAVSITNLWSMEYWFLKNSSMIQLQKRISLVRGGLYSTVYVRCRPSRAARHQRGNDSLSFRRKVVQLVRILHSNKRVDEVHSVLLCYI